MAKLVILGPLLFIGQHLIGFVDVLEFLLRLFVVWMQIWMILLGQLSEGAFDVRIRSIPVHA